MQEVTLFYQSNIRRESEAAFFCALRDRLPDAQTLNEHFLVSSDYLDKFVDAHKVAAWLQSNALLPDKRRRTCIQLLQSAASRFIRVALKPSDISFDVVATRAGEIYYWGFHEKQHQRLSVDRPKHVYAPDGTPIEVPRYLKTGRCPTPRARMLSSVGESSPTSVPVWQRLVWQGAG